MEKYCVSLEIAKKLVEAGWKKETEFCYKVNIVLPTNGFTEVCEYEIISKDKIKPKKRVEFYPAHLSDEILEEFPDSIKEYKFYIFKDERGYGVGYSTDDENEEHRVLGQKENERDNEIPFIEKSLPNALALMYIYLKSNNLLEGGK